MLTDPIADMLTRIRNAARVHRKTVDVPASKVHRGIATVLMHEGYVLRFDEVDDGKQGVLRIHLKYGPDGEQVIQEIRRVSKGGRRVYAAVKEIPEVMEGMGIAILSTSRGVMSDRRARKLNIGGEVLCTVC